MQRDASRRKTQLKKRCTLWGSKKEWGCDLGGFYISIFTRVPACETDLCRCVLCYTCDVRTTLLPPFVSWFCSRAYTATTQRWRPHFLFPFAGDNDSPVHGWDELDCPSWLLQASEELLRRRSSIWPAANVTENETRTSLRVGRIFLRRTTMVSKESLCIYLFIFC